MYPASKSNSAADVFFYSAFKAVARCIDLDSVLTKLAKRYATTKFLRVRADALGFAMVRRESRGIEGENEDEDMEYGERRVDTDVLPTMQVYRGGELVLNWVRVDWEAGKAGVAELLERFLVILFLRSSIDKG
jgi:hypothetical protein